MVIWYCEPQPLFVSAQHKKTRHTSQILRPFTFPLNRKDENSKTHSKRSSQIEICGSGQLLNENSKAKIPQHLKRGKSIQFKDFQRFYSNGNAIILGPLSHHPDNVLHLKLKLYFVILQFLFRIFKICQFPLHFIFPFLYSSFLASRCMNCEVVFQWGLELQQRISEHRSVSNRQRWGNPRNVKNQADAMNSFASYSYLWHIAYQYLHVMKSLYLQPIREKDLSAGD